MSDVSWVERFKGHPERTYAALIEYDLAPPRSVRRGAKHYTSIAAQDAGDQRPPEGVPGYAVPPGC